VAGFISESWPTSNRNGGRLQIGSGGRIASEFPYAPVKIRSAIQALTATITGWSLIEPRLKIRAATHAKAAHKSRISGPTMFEAYGGRLSCSARIATPTPAPQFAAPHHKAARPPAILPPINQQNHAARKRDDAFGKCESRSVERHWDYRSREIIRAIP
jgi:hypothetical protein